MTTNTYALSRTERVWLLFSVTLLVSAAFYGVLAHRVVGVMVSPEDYAAMREFYADRLARTLRETASEAARKGLTDSELERLLSDEG